MFKILLDKSMLKRVISALMILFVISSCSISFPHDLAGCWINSIVRGTSYTNSVLLLKSEPIKNFNGIYIKAYSIENEVVQESRQEGKWSCQSKYSSTYKGYINIITLVPNDPKKVARTYEFLYDSSVLKLIDRTAEKPIYEAFTLSDAFPNLGE